MQLAKLFNRMRSALQRNDSDLIHLVRYIEISIGGTTAGAARMPEESSAATQHVQCLPEAYTSNHPSCIAPLARAKDSTSGMVMIKGSVIKTSRQSSLVHSTRSKESTSGGVMVNKSSVSRE